MEQLVKKLRAENADLVRALEIALDYIEGYKVHGLPDLGAVDIDYPHIDDVLRLGDSVLTKDYGAAE